MLSCMLTKLIMLNSTSITSATALTSTTFKGKTKVDSIDDNEELEYTEDAFNVLGFSEQEKFDCYMLTAGKYNLEN